MRNIIVLRLFQVILGLVIPAISDFADKIGMDPATAYATTSLVIMLGVEGISKWLRKPVAEIMEVLEAKGVFDGRPDGVAGPKFKRAVARAIDDPDISVDDDFDRTPVRKARPAPHSKNNPLGL